MSHFGMLIEHAVLTTNAPQLSSSGDLNLGRSYNDRARC